MMGVWRLLEDVQDVVVGQTVCVCDTSRNGIAIDPPGRGVR